MVRDENCTRFAGFSLVEMAIFPQTGALECFSPCPLYWEGGEQDSRQLPLGMMASLQTTFAVSVLSLVGSVGGCSEYALCRFAPSKAEASQQPVFRSALDRKSFVAFLRRNL